MPRYETYAKVKEMYNVSPETVRSWARKGQIQYKCIQNATRKTWLFDIDSIGKFMEDNTDKVDADEIAGGKRDHRIIYVRVSSAGQVADLARQRDLLSRAFPDAEVITDIGSGLNYHKPGFTSLVRKICRDQVSQVIITFRDRLCRFGFELLELVCKEHGCNILVYGNGIEDHINGIPEHPEQHVHDPEFELKEDLLSIVNVFVASHNGRRAAMLKKERERLALSDAQHGIPDGTLADHNLLEPTDVPAENNAGGNVAAATEQVAIQPEIIAIAPKRAVRGPGRRKVAKDPAIAKTAAKRNNQNKIVPDIEPKEEIGQVV